MALLTVADLAGAMGRTFTSGTADYTQAQYFCDLVTAVISQYTDVQFSSTEKTERYQADYNGVVTLGSYPVTAVAEIRTLSGSVRVGWLFDGINEIDGLEAHEVVDIKFTSGYSSPPNVLKLLSIAVASRLMANPTGMRQETVGAISGTFAASSGDAGTVYFTDAERRVLDDFKETSTSWSIGPRSRLWQTEGLLPVL
jgi:hypothetical protein